MVDMDDNKLLHFPLIPLLLELKVTEKLEKVGFILSSVVELDTLHKEVIRYAYVNQDS